MFTPNVDNQFWKLQFENNVIEACWELIKTGSFYSWNILSTYCFLGEFFYVSISLSPNIRSKITPENLKKI